jgi:hypothetical protein
MKVWIESRGAELTTLEVSTSKPARGRKCSKSTRIQEFLTLIVPNLRQGIPKRLSKNRLEVFVLLEFILRRNIARHRPTHPSATGIIHNAQTGDLTGDDANGIDRIAGRRENLLCAQLVLARNQTDIRHDSPTDTAQENLIDPPIAHPQRTEFSRWTRIGSARFGGTTGHEHYRTGLGWE